SHCRKRPRAAQCASRGIVSRKPKGESVGLRVYEWPSKPIDQNHQQGTKMKQIRTSFSTIGVIALLALTVGCATTATFPREKATSFVASGLKTITAVRAAKQQKLQELQAAQVATIQKTGRTYYIVADP